MNNESYKAIMRPKQINEVALEAPSEAPSEGAEGYAVGNESYKASMKPREFHRIDPEPREFHRIDPDPLAEDRAYAKDFLVSQGFTDEASANLTAAREREISDLAGVEGFNSYWHAAERGGYGLQYMEQSAMASHIYRIGLKKPTDQEVWKHIATSIPVNDPQHMRLYLETEGHTRKEADRIAALEFTHRIPTGPWVKNLGAGLKGIGPDVWQTLKQLISDPKGVGKAVVDLVAEIPEALEWLESWSPLIPSESPLARELHAKYPDIRPRRTPRDRPPVSEFPELFPNLAAAITHFEYLQILCVSEALRALRGPLPASKETKARETLAHALFWNDFEENASEYLLDFLGAYRSVGLGVKGVKQGGKISKRLPSPTDGINEGRLPRRVRGFLNDFRLGDFTMGAARVVEGVIDPISAAVELAAGGAASFLRKAVVGMKRVGPMAGVHPDMADGLEMEKNLTTPQPPAEKMPSGLESDPWASLNEDYEVEVRDTITVEDQRPEGGTGATLRTDKGYETITDTMEVPNPEGGTQTVRLDTNSPQTLDAFPVADEPLVEGPLPHYVTLQGAHMTERLREAVLEHKMKDNATNKTGWDKLRTVYANGLTMVEDRYLKRRNLRGETSEMTTAKSMEMLHTGLEELNELRKKTLTKAYSIMEGAFTKDGMKGRRMDYEIRLLQPDTDPWASTLAAIEEYLNTAGTGVVRHNDSYLRSFAEDLRNAETIGVKDPKLEGIEMKGVELERTVFTEPSSVAPPQKTSLPETEVVQKMTLRLREVGGPMTVRDLIKGRKVFREEFGEWKLDSPIGSTVIRNKIIVGMGEDLDRALRHVDPKLAEMRREIDTRYAQLVAYRKNEFFHNLSVDARKAAPGSKNYYELAHNFQIAEDVLNNSESVGATLEVINQILKDVPDEGRMGLQTVMLKDLYETTMESSRETGLRVFQLGGTGQTRFQRLMEAQDGRYQKVLRATLGDETVDSLMDLHTLALKTEKVKLTEKELTVWTRKDAIDSKGNPMPQKRVAPSSYIGFYNIVQKLLYGSAFSMAAGFAAMAGQGAWAGKIVGLSIVSAIGKARYDAWRVTRLAKQLEVDHNIEWRSVPELLRESPKWSAAADAFSSTPATVGIHQVGRTLYQAGVYEGDDPKQFDYPPSQPGRTRQN